MQPCAWQTGLGEALQNDRLDALVEFVSTRSGLLVLTGAGCSTPSGIGDYRDRNGAWKRAAPIQHADFMRSAAVRRRYWARSFVGWPRFAAAAPNAAHQAIAALKPLGLITQNVDRLHQKAGSRPVVDLHGRLDQVVCTDCGALGSRAELQVRLAEANDWLAERPFALAPDGDADIQLTDAEIARVDVPACMSCGGVLKPHVVFYGDGVPRARVSQGYDWVDECDGLLVIGSSLMVFSSLRFCRRASARGVPMALANQGVTRADELFAVRVDAPCQDVLPTLLGRLRPSEAGPVEPR